MIGAVATSAASGHFKILMVINFHSGRHD